MAWSQGKGLPHSPRHSLYSVYRIPCPCVTLFPFKAAGYPALMQQRALSVAGLYVCVQLLPWLFAFSGTVKESGAKHKGLIEIPSLSEENEVEDTEVPVMFPLTNTGSGFWGAWLLSGAGSGEWAPAMCVDSLLALFSPRGCQPWAAVAPGSEAGPLADWVCEEGFR